MDDVMQQLTDGERLAVGVIADIYTHAWSSPVLDGVDRWDRLATRVASAGESPDLARAVTRLAFKLESPAVHGPRITKALSADHATRQQILRAWRTESTAIVAIVRHLRDQDKAARRAGQDAAADDHAAQQTLGVPA